LRDISRKINTFRTAKAHAVLKASPDTIRRIQSGDLPKADPLPIARVAAVQAAKNTSQIIPYCHPMPIEFVGVDFVLGTDKIDIDVEVKAIYKTGVEMEALTAASVAALTLYDMLKIIDEDMEIGTVRLVQKKGGKSDFKDKKLDGLKCAVLVMSDSVSEGKKTDESGRLIEKRLRDEGLEVADYRVIPDEREQIEKQLKQYADEMKIDFVITTGGTGLSPRDCTPEAMANVIERNVPGMAEAARAYGQDRTPYSMLSRGMCGVRGKTLIVNLPGSRGGVADSLDALFPAVLHAFNMMRAGRHHN
jgi:cyclic pyranopterin monophosphate synthase